MKPLTLQWTGWEIAKGGNGRGEGERGEKWDTGGREGRKRIGRGGSREGRYTSLCELSVPYIMNLISII